MTEFDYIVVGGGAAGSVLANRLSTDGASVLVLEAGGGDLPDDVADPAGWLRLLGGPIDWGYHSVPQPGLLGRSTVEPRGRALGGTSNLYAMMHVRGHPSDFDNWAYQGAAGWAYHDVLPYFDGLESPATHAGDSGHPASRAFIEACLELGYDELADFNSGELIGAGWHRLDIADGRRRSARMSYLEPVLDRLTVRTSARATRLLMNGRECVGVEYLWRSSTRRAHAHAEVIVAAGAIESPKLLMLSGIGHPGELAEFDIPVTAPLSGVGKNFHNHVLTGVQTEACEEVPPPTHNFSESALFATSAAGLPSPDIQLAFVHAPFSASVGRDHPNTVSVLPGVVQPKSRGWVRLASADPRAKPLVHPNYLGDRADVERLVYAVRLARAVVATRAFSDWNKQELAPGGGVYGDRALEEFVRRNADSYHHHAGSCRMGIDDLAVVDPALRVHGVARLRVADASVMPALPSCNPHTAVLMIAARAADFARSVS